MLTVACLVPMGFAAPLNGAGDVILLIYLLTLSRHLHTAGGLAAGSTYSLARHQPRNDDHDRPGAAVGHCIGDGAVHAHSFRAGHVLNGSVYADERLSLVRR